MASFWFLLELIVSIMIFPALSSSAELNSQAGAAIFTSPASLINSPTTPLSPFQELSPDIAPLLPSPSVSSVPIISSNANPPDPNEVITQRPDPAFSPLGSLPASSAMRKNLMSWAAALGCAVYWCLLLFKM